MNEKKLTDEEIVKALEWASKTSEWTANIAGKNQNMFCAILDLIHRLQDEKQKVVQDYYCEAQHCDIQKDIIEKQKAEIERLTREKTESAKTAVEVLEQNIELQKQVDEWKTECQELHDECENCWANKKLNSKQAVKDTAKEILQAVLEDVGEFYAGDIVEQLSKRYCVEVE